MKSGRAHRKSTVAKYARMTAKELHRAASEFDQEMIIARSRALTAEERSSVGKARRQPGRPRRGRGVRVVSVSLEQDLLARSDALARSLGVSRVLLIERGLKAVLAAQGRL